jgi:hypothetical protein
MSNEVAQLTRSILSRRGKFHPATFGFDRGTRGLIRVHLRSSAANSAFQQAFHSPSPARLICRIFSRRDDFLTRPIDSIAWRLVLSAFICVHLRPILPFSQPLHSPSPFWLRPRRASSICGQFCLSATFPFTVANLVAAAPRYVHVRPVLPFGDLSIRPRHFGCGPSTPDSSAAGTILPS